MLLWLQRNKMGGATIRAPPLSVGVTQEECVTNCGGRYDHVIPGDMAVTWPRLEDSALELDGGDILVEIVHSPGSLPVRHGVTLC